MSTPPLPALSPFSQELVDAFANALREGEQAVEQAVAEWRDRELADAAQKLATVVRAALDSGQGPFDVARATYARLVAAFAAVGISESDANLALTFARSGVVAAVRSLHTPGG